MSLPGSGSPSAIEAAQAQVLDAIRAPIDEPSPDAAPVDADSVFVRAVARIRGDERASAAERLHVYQHMYRARLTETLEEQFPRLARAWAARGDFAELAFDYVTAYPSRHPSLRELGRHLPDWLADAHADVDFASSLARLEWARADVFDALDQPALRLDDLREVPPERFGALPLSLLDGHRFVRVRAGTAACWDALAPVPEHDATDGDHSERADLTANVLDTPTDGDDTTRDDELLLVWREDVTVFHRVLPAHEAAALERVASGTTFGAVCEALAGDLDPEAATARAFGWLSTWLADGLLVAAAASDV